MSATGGSFRYATGAHAGQAIADPAALNGNGLIAIYNIRDRRQQDVGSITNDIRASRVWNVGDGVLTTTAGLYTGRQQIDTSILYGVAVTEVKGGGDAALLNVVDAGGNARTAGGIYAYNPLSGTQRRTLRLAYAINAPFASANAPSSARRTRRPPAAGPPACGATLTPRLSCGASAAGATRSEHSACCERGAPSA